MKRIIIALALALTLLPVVTVDAALLTGVKVEMDNSSGESQTSHTYYFTKDIGAIARMEFQYCLNPSVTCGASDVGVGSISKPPSSAVVFGGATNEHADWTPSAGTETVIYAHSGAGGAAGAGEYVVSIDNIDNPNYDDCTFNAPGNDSSGTCFVWFQTYSSSDNSVADDDGVATITITRDISITARVDPSFQFTVTDVDETQLRHTSITTDVSTSITTIPFGNLTANTEVYAAHDLTIISNTDGGYVVTATMEEIMTGVAYDYDIDPFGEAATDNANTWSQPSSTTAGDDTGWLGIGTDDTDVTGAAEDEFFPLGTHDQQVALSTTSSLATGDPVEIVYAIEVNASHPADNYIGTMYYNATPTY